MRHHHHGPRRQASLLVPIALIVAIVVIIITSQYLSYRASLPIPRGARIVCPVCPKSECKSDKQLYLRPPMCPVDSINFEPPGPNRLTGPRRVPLVRGAKSLVAMTMGERSKDNLNQVIQTFGTDKFTYHIFPYDNVKLNQYPWSSKVFRIRFPHQLKWWYLKRFVTPEAVDMFAYIVIVDEDADISELDIGKDKDGFTGAFPHSANSKRIGRWVRSVQDGPVTLVSRQIWQQCVSDAVQDDLATGTGIELVWTTWCAKLGWSNFAIVDAFPVGRIPLPSPTADFNPDKKSEEEKAELLDRFFDEETKQELLDSREEILGYITEK